MEGRGGGQVVNILAFFSANQSSNPAGYENFLDKKTNIDEKEAGAGPSINITLRTKVIIARLLTHKFLSKMKSFSNKILLPKTLLLQNQ